MFLSCFCSPNQNHRTAEARWALHDNRNPGSLMTELDGQNLWNRHEHSEEGHTSQQATKQCVVVGSMSRWSNRVWKHSRLQVQSFGSMLGRIVFYPQSLEAIKFRRRKRSSLSSGFLSLRPD